MSLQHWLLAFFWILYCAVHSILAASSFKLFIEKKVKGFYRYYRLLYSIFALVTLLLVLCFQYSFQSIVLINSFFVKWSSFVLLLVPGIAIMMVSISKYFLLLSGVRSIYMPAPVIQLKMDGIHKYVRHPLYLGTLLFIWGLFFIFPMLNNLIAVIIITMYVFAGIIFEEKKLLQQFGNSYTDYISAVPMIFPVIFKKKKHS